VTAPATTRAADWHPAEGLTPRGTLVLLPGRGEHPGVYERFGRRLAADAYVVHVLDQVAGPDQQAVVAEIARLAAGGPVPLVLAGSDTGALRALIAAADPSLRVDAVLLAGTALGAGGGSAADWDGDGWDGELTARTACPTHRGRLDADPGFGRGSLAEPVPAELSAAAERAARQLGELPVLLVHGEADPVSPVAEARRLASELPRAVLATVADGRHDALNDISHRSVAATVVQWLERLRGGSQLPVVVTLSPADGR
jgi:alpha-beta hydrolase superfamily lysophospholipase